MNPRSSTVVLGGNFTEIPFPRRYSLRQDRIILTLRIQTAVDPIALLQQAGFPCADASDAFLVNCPGRLDFAIGLICKTPQAVLARTRALGAPSIRIFS